MRFNLNIHLQINDDNSSINVCINGSWVLIYLQVHFKVTILVYQLPLEELEGKIFSSITLNSEQIKE